MSILSGVLSNLEGQLPKVISPKAHGYIDYAHSALFLAAGLFFWGRNKRASIAALSTGAFILTEALLTDYPLGAKPVIPFATHGEIDSGFVPAALSLPRFLGIADDPAAWFFRANAFAETFVVGLTDFDSNRAHQDRLLESGEQGSFAQQAA